MDIQGRAFYRCGQQHHHQALGKVTSRGTSSSAVRPSWTDMHRCTGSSPRSTCQGSWHPRRHRPGRQWTRSSRKNARREHGDSQSESREHVHEVILLTPALSRRSPSLDLPGRDASVSMQFFATSAKACRRCRPTAIASAYRGKLLMSTYSSQSPSQPPCPT